MLIDIRRAGLACCFRLARGAWVLLLATAAQAAVIVGGDPGQVNPDPLEWAWNVYPSVGIESGKTGTVTIQDGDTVRSNCGYLGVDTGSTGNVTVTGAGSTWINSVWVGCSGNGSLTVQDGGIVNSFAATIAADTGSTGNVTVAGAGSTWTTSWDLLVGSSGNGSLTVQDNGAVSTPYGYLGYSSGATGNVTLSGAGATWTNTNYVEVGYSGNGSLTIQNDGALSSSGGAIGSGAGSTGNVMVTGAGSTWTNNWFLSVGGNGNGSLTIQDGGAVSSSQGTLGAATGSTGNVTVTGAGSTWTNTNYVEVGHSGNGSLTIQDGGIVNSFAATIAAATGSTGNVTVTGAGSTWANSGSLVIGNSGTGSLTIKDCARVTASYGNVNSTSSLKLYVDDNGMLSLGTASRAGRFTNDGKVNLYATAFMASGTFTPISDLNGRTMAWSGSGVYNTLGGSWDTLAHTFTIADAIVAQTGTAYALSPNERLLIGTAGHQVGASFGSSVDSSMTFSAMPMSAGELGGLVLSSGESVLSAWDFNSGTLSNPVLLSFDIGAGCTDLQVWHYDHSKNWSAYAPSDLTYDNGIASFTVNGFSGYAVTGTNPVPEPGSLALLATALVGVIVAARRRKK